MGGNLSGPNTYHWMSMYFTGCAKFLQGVVKMVLLHGNLCDNCMQHWSILLITFSVRTDALAAVSAVHCYPIVQVHLRTACC